MIRIIKVLMDFGMDFEYENRGSEGEKIVSYELGLDISNQNGKIYYSCGCEPETVEDVDFEYMRLASEVQDECIAQTASF